MSELLNSQSYDDDRHWSWGMSEAHLALHEQYLRSVDGLEGRSLEDLSQEELEYIELSLKSAGQDDQEQAPTQSIPGKSERGSVEELEALFALPEIEEPEVNS